MVLDCSTTYDFNTDSKRIEYIVTCSLSRAFTKSCKVGTSDVSSDWHAKSDASELAFSTFSKIVVGVGIGTLMDMRNKLNNRW